MTVIVTIPHDSEDIAARIVEACDLPACDFEQAVFQGLPVTHEIAAHSTIAFQYFRYGFGGAEKVTFELMQLFSEMGYRVVLYTDIEPEPNDLPVPEGVIRKHVCAGYDDRESRVEYWREQVEAEGIAALVYGSWCSPAALLDCLAVQSAGAAFLFCVHGCSPFFMQIDDPPLPLRLERVGRCADAVIVLSEADKAFWDAYNPNVHVVVNPVARYMSRVPVAESPARGHTVLWSGRFSFYEKQPADAVEILAELRKIVPDAKLVFLGAGTPEETAKLKGIVEENGVAGAVTFAGYQEDPMPYYQVADALLVTSVSEGFGLSIAEAMHQGMPVVAYDLGYLLLMQDGGVVKVPHGGIRAAASALAKLLDDPVEHDEQAARGRARYEAVCEIDLAVLWQGVLDSCSEIRGEMAQTPQAFMIREMVRHWRVSDAKRVERENDARGREAELIADRDRIRQAYDELEHSTMMKVGRAATAAPRAFKDLLTARKRS